MCAAGQVAEAIPASCASGCILATPWLQPGEALRGRVRIQFVDEHGLEEAGIDGGGLFKDFMEHLVREVGPPHPRGASRVQGALRTNAGPA